MKISIRQLTVAGVLGALMIVMGMVGTGLIPVPNLAGAMTLMHIPIIIGAILEGPLVGFLLGIIFAVFVYIQFGAIFPPHVLIPARLLIGPVSWLVYVGIKRLLENKKAIGNLVSTFAIVLVILVIVGAGFFAFNISPESMKPIDPNSVPGGLTQDQASAFHALQTQISGLQSSAINLKTGGYTMLIVLGVMFLFSYFGMSSLMKEKSEQTSVTISAIAGTLTNAVITLGLGVVFPTILGETVTARLYSAVAIFGMNTTIEIVLAVTACVAVVPSIQNYFKFRES